MQNPPPVQSGKSSTGLDENIASLIAYLAGWVSGLIFFLIERDSRLVRFHAMQAILLNVAFGVVAVILQSSSPILVIVLEYDLRLARHYRKHALGRCCGW